jgi:hypothetical protein
LAAKRAVTTILRTTVSTRDNFVDFVALPVAAGWYGVICLAGRGKTLRHAVYFDGFQWRKPPMFAWFRSTEHFETAHQARAWLDNLPD